MRRMLQPSRASVKVQFLWVLDVAMSIVLLLLRSHSEASDNGECCEADGESEDCGAKRKLRRQPENWEAAAANQIIA